MTIKKLTLQEAVSCICAAVTAILNVVFYFLLPPYIVTQISFSGDSNAISSVLFLAGIALLVIIAAAMTIFQENKKKWMLVSIILAILNISVIIYNYVIL